MKKGVLKNFPKFTGKHLCQSLFFNKADSEACNFIKKGILAQVFSCEFCVISKNTFFTEHLWTTTSVLMVMIIRVSGKFPPGKFPPREFPPGIFPPMFLNIPYRVFKFFVFFIIVTVITDIT